MDIICIQQPSKSSVPFIMLIERKTQTGIFKDPRDYNAILGCIPLYVVFIYGTQHNIIKSKDSLYPTEFNIQTNGNKVLLTE